MKELSKDIELAVENAIEVLNFDVDIVSVKSEKLQALMSSKIDTFASAKEMIVLWQNSMNAPNYQKLEKYIKQLVIAGDSAIEVLRMALRKNIDPDEVNPEDHGKSAKAKPLIFRAIAEINRGVIELRTQLESGIIDLKSREFKRSFPEKFASQEFYPARDYHKEWQDEKTGAIMICPKGTKGEIIVLDNLQIMLPKVPAKKDILFSRLPQEEQYWRRETPPSGLSPDNEDEYVEYILLQFKRRREGVWFMNNGIPTYLTGAQWMGLQWNKMLDTGGYKEFRLAQANMYYFTKACILDPRCVGELFVKGRRTGFTEEILDHIVDDSTSMKNALMGMTSKSDVDAAEAFWKYSYTVQNLPFFFVPVVKGKIDDKNKMEFGKVSDSSKAAKQKRDNNTDDYLNTKVDYMPNITLAYDSKKLVRYLCDEAGKREKPSNIIDHWNNVKPTMVTGGRVVGKCFMGSTLNPLDKGGREFQQLYYGSDVTKRNDNDRTATGLYSFFLPAHMNMEDYTDKYGVCHTVLSPGEFFFNAQGQKKTQGSLQFLENEFKSAKSMGGKVYNNTRRLDPVTIEDAFRDELQSSLFDIEKIHAQINFNRNTNIESNLVRGNFSWKDGVKDSSVVWNPTPRGRFLIAWIPPLELRNKSITKPVFGQLTKCPSNDFGAFGCDSYDQTAVVDAKLIETENGQEYNIGSKGSVHGLTGMSLGNVPSNFFFLEYVARPETADMFFEDILMACVFYSLPILVENNKKLLLKHFKNRGYRGYCINRYDKSINRLSVDEKELGGIPNSSPDIINQHWVSIESYIRNYVGEYFQGEDPSPIRTEGEMGSMPFNRTLMDWLKFNVKDRTKFDASISSGLAILAVNRHLYSPKEERKPFSLKLKTYRI